MSFGLGQGRELDDAPGVIGVDPAVLPPLPDDLLQNPESARVNVRTWFEHPERPVELEIGCGKGGFLLDHASATPDVNILGIEYAREFYMYSADRVRRRGLKNVRMLHADATEFLRWRCPTATLSVIHLYYSDPWPKRKHHKNRVIQHEFLGQAWRVLIDGGELRIVTDHDDLWAWNEKHLAAWTGSSDGPRSISPGLVPENAAFVRRPFAPPAWAAEGQTVGTNYERKFTHADKPPHAAVLVKRGNVIARPITDGRE